MDEQRIISFSGEVNEVSAFYAIIQLLYYDSQNHEEPIYMYINSGGGSIIAGLSIYDTIKHIKAPVYTICTGFSASMGAFLLSCGEKGHRGALKHSRILIHQPLVSSEGGFYKKERDVRKMADSLQENRVTLENIMAENAGQPVERVHADCERDNWMTPEEAKEYGLIDYII